MGSAFDWWKAVLFSAVSFPPLPIYSPISLMQTRSFLVYAAPPLFLSGDNFYDQYSRLTRSDGRYLRLLRTSREADSQAEYRQCRVSLTASLTYWLNESWDFYNCISLEIRKTSRESIHIALDCDNDSHCYGVVRIWISHKFPGDF